MLTNDGDLKRRLELPSTGWLRKYRVRVNGRPTDDLLAPLKLGITVGGEKFQPMMVTIDKQQGANAWLTVGIREGRNREVRRAMEAVGLTVNRLIRTAYGPFQLGNLASGAVEELRPRSLRDQLGLQDDEVADGRGAPMEQVKPARKSGTGTGPARPATKTPVKGAAKGPASRDEAPGRKSWGAKSHGGSRKTLDGDPTKPKSWGSKSARPTAGNPRKPGPSR